MSKFINLEYTKNGDYMSVELENGKSTRRRVEWKTHKSPEPKVCAFSGNSIKKGDKLGTLPLKQKGLKTLYFHPDFQQHLEKEQQKDALEEIYSLVSYVDSFVEDKQGKIFKEEKDLKRSLAMTKRKKELIGNLRSKLHSVVTSIKTLEDI